MHGNKSLKASISQNDKLPLATFCDSRKCICQAARGKIEKAFPVKVINLCELMLEFPSYGQKPLTKRSMNYKSNIQNANPLFAQQSADETFFGDVARNGGTKCSLIINARVIFYASKFIYSFNGDRK